MSAPPYMKLYVGDYLGDTTHLTTLEHGAYLLLLFGMWRAGGKLPADDAKLARIAQMTAKEWTSVKAVILPFFKRRGAILTHKRVAEEMAHYKTVSLKRKEAGKTGGKLSAGKITASSQANAKQLLPKPEPEPEVRLEPIKGSKSNRRASAKARLDGAFAPLAVDPAQDNLTSMERLRLLLAQQDAETPAHA